MRPKSRAGLAPLVLALIVTSVGMILGVAHFASARAARLSGHRQADYLKARYLAQAGLHKAMVVLKRQHQLGKYTWAYPVQRGGRWIPDEEFSGEVDEGRFEVTRVEPVTLDAKERAPRVLANREYRVRGRLAGHYDVYRIEAVGAAPMDRQRVTLSATVKLVRLLVRPSTEEP